MKTNLKRLLGINKIIILSAVATLFATSKSMAVTFSIQNDTSSFVSIYGKVIDKETRKAINYTNVVLIGSSTGTVANAEGEFLLKVPKNRVSEKVGFTHLGYKTYTATVEQLKNTENTIVLEQELISLQEIIVRMEDPMSLIRGAYNNIHLNYSTKPVMITSFYRETMKQNRRYVSIAEAVIETNKTSYTSTANDRVRVIIGRKSQDVKKMDTIMVKLQGGPLTPFFLDIVKHPENLISEENIENYDLKLSGQISYDNKRCYVVEFNQKDNSDEPFFDGKLYIEVESLAIVATEFSISKLGLKKASSIFVKKKPLSLKFETLGADYIVKYTENNGKWGLSYVRADLRFKCKWQKKLFSSNYTAMVEMAVTELDTLNVSKIKIKDMVKESDVFSDQAEAFKNDEYWGDYNIIIPEESIQSAIEKLNKKFKKK